MKRISIVMPCHNAALTIGAAVASVRVQTLPDWELIIVDDGSTDDTVRVVSAIEDARIRLITQSNRGAAAARNAGLREAQADFVAFLDSDDEWDSRFLEKMHAALAGAPAAVLAYCGWQNRGLDEGRSKPFVPPDYNAMDRAEMLLGGCRWPIHGVLVRRAAIERSQGFDETMPASQDYDLWFRVADAGSLVLVPEVLAYYNHHGGVQITKNRCRGALSHLRAQMKFLQEHPEHGARLGRRRVRELTMGELLRRAYAAYWARDLATARPLFRRVMRSVYGRPGDWVHMLPSLLPIGLHAKLLEIRDGMNAG